MQQVVGGVDCEEELEVEFSAISEPRREFATDLSAGLQRAGSCEEFTRRRDGRNGSMRNARASGDLLEEKPHLCKNLKDGPPNFRG
jgi:hypothetical protein